MTKLFRFCETGW